VSRNANGLGHPDAIGAHAWTHIAQVQPPHAGHTVLAGAESASVGTGIQDRGPGPSRYHGPGPGPGRGTEIIMGDSQGHARGLDLGSGDAHALTRGHGPVLVLVRGPAHGHAPDRGRGRAIGEVDTESALADLAPKVGPRVAAAVGNAKDGEREVARRMYAFFWFSFNLCSGGLIWWPSTEREKRKEEKWDGIGRCFRRPMGQIRYY
jgi:hypothetical protein